MSETDPTKKQQELLLRESLREINHMASHHPAVQAAMEHLESKTTGAAGEFPEDGLNFKESHERLMSRTAFRLAHQQILAAVERPHFPRCLRHDALEAAATIERFSRQLNAYVD